jgi:hypothetical protein
MKMEIVGMRQTIAWKNTPRPMIQDKITPKKSLYRKIFFIPGGLRRDWNTLRCSAIMAPQWRRLTLKNPMSLAFSFPNRPFRAIPATLSDNGRKAADFPSEWVAGMRRNTHQCSDCRSPLN